MIFDIFEDRYREPDEQQQKILMIVSIVKAVEFAFILAFAFHNLIRYIITMQSNKTLIIIFYVIACTESLLIIG